MAIDSTTKKYLVAAITAVILSLSGLVVYINSQPDTPPVVVVPPDTTVVVTPPPPPPVSGHPFTSPTSSGTVLAILPRTTPSVTYPTGLTVMKIAAGSNLQTAINNAPLGSELRLAMCSSFTANLTLPNKTGSGWVVIRADTTDAALGTGRMTPSHAASLCLPKIITINSTSAIATSLNAHHYRLTGLEVVGNFPTGEIYSLVALGGFAGDGQTSIGVVAHDIVVDRSYIHGSLTQFIRRCIALNSATTAIVDSWLDDCHSNNSDSQGILGMNGPGPFLIRNNTIKAGHQMIMFGGGDPAISRLVPSDITVQQNHMTRPVAWRVPVGEYPPKASLGHWTAKTIVESKNSQFVLYEGNVLDGSWTSAWPGTAVTFKSVNQDGGCKWCQTSHLTFRYNVIKNVGNVFNLAGHPEAYALDSNAHHFSIYDNSGDSVNVGVFNGPGDAFAVYGVNDLLIAHNSIVNPSGRSGILFDAAAVPQGNQRTTFVGNILGGAYLINGPLSQIPGALLSGNVWVTGGPCPSYATASGVCSKVFAAPAGVQTVFGRPAGPDMAKVNAMTAGVVVAP